jgi:putative membrane protein
MGGATHPAATAIHAGAGRKRAMEQSPYAGLGDKPLILRDELAIERTILANERTLLSYLRSGVSLIIAGVSIMHFATARWFFVFGAACLPVAVVTLAAGTWRFVRKLRQIELVRRPEA